MLKKVRITNFLSCQDTEIELDAITALIGRNAAGKSNILKVVQWCAQFAVGNTSIYEYLHPSLMTDAEGQCSIEFLIDKEIFKYEIKINPISEFMDMYLQENLWCYINNEWRLISERGKESATQYYKDKHIDFEIKASASLIASILLFVPKKKLNPIIKKISEQLSTINYYTLNDGVNDDIDNISYGLIVNTQYEQWRSKNGTDRSLVVMRLLDLWHKDKEILDELKALVGENGLNLIDDIKITEIDLLTPMSMGKNQQQDSSIIYTISFNMANAVVNYTQLSYGTQRVLTLLLALLYDKNSTLLIEQPEDGIHSGLLKKLLPLCFEYAEVYNKQIIIATHSPDVINLLPPESIRLVKMTEKGTKVAALNKDQIPMIRDYMKHEGALFDFIKSMNDE